MNDVFGNKLNIDDTVAFNEPRYTYRLVTGKIVKFTPKKLLIEWYNDMDRRATQTYKFPSQVAKNMGAA